MKISPTRRGQRSDIKKEKKPQNIFMKPWLRKLLYASLFAFLTFVTLLGVGTFYIAYHPYSQDNIPQNIRPLIHEYLPNHEVDVHKFKFYWNIPTRSFVIELKKVLLVEKKNQGVKNTVESLRMQFPLTSLLHLNLWPQSIWVDGVNIKMSTFEEKNDQNLGTILKDSLGTLSEIDNLVLSNANLLIQSKFEKNQSITAEFNLTKKGKRLEAKIAHQMANDKFIEVTLLTKNQEKFSVGIQLNQLALKEFFQNISFLLPQDSQKFLQYTEVVPGTIGGNLRFVIYQNKGIQSIDVDLHTPEIHLPALDDNEKGKSLVLSEVALVGALSEKSIQLSKLDFSHKHLKVHVNADSSAHMFSGFKGKLAVQMEHMTIEDLVQFWPAGLSEVGRRWIHKNLSEGVLSPARLEFDHELVMDSGEEGTQRLVKMLDKSAHKLSNIKADFQLHNMKVHYMENMPFVEHVIADGKLDSQKLVLQISGGESSGQLIKSGTVVISEMDQEDQNMNLDLVLNGDLKGALELADHDPIFLLREYDLLPKSFQGEVQTQLKLTFPLYMDLKRSEIKAHVLAKISNAAAHDIVKDTDVSVNNSAFNLEIINTGTNPGIQITGQGKLLDEDYNVQIHESFALENGAHPTHYHQQLSLTTQFTNRHFSRFWNTPKGMIEGHVPTSISRTLHHTEKAHTDGTLLLQFDFKAAKIELPDIGLHKAHDEPLTVQMKADLLNGHIIAIQDFRSYDNQKLVWDGNFHWNPRNDLFQQGTFSLKTPENTMKIDMRRNKDAHILMGVTLKFLNIKSSWDRFKKSTTSADVAHKKSAPIFVHLKADQVFYNEELLMEDLNGALEYNRNQLDDLNFAGKLVSGDNKKQKNFTISTQKDPKEGPVFVFVTEDFGHVMRAMGFESKVQSGTLTIKAYKKSLPNLTFWRGDYKIEKFLLEDAPGVLKLFRIVSPTVITEVFNRDKGVRFDSVLGRFRYDEDGVNLYEGQALSPALGLTFDGTIDTREKKIDLTGTLIPAYGLNAAIGYIPVIGQIFTGGPGEGLVAFNFTMRGDYDDPEIISNPLSALTPGFLRKLARGKPARIKEEYPEKDSPQEDPNKSSSVPSKELTSKNPTESTIESESAQEEDPEAPTILEDPHEDSQAPEE